MIPVLKAARTLVDNWEPYKQIRTDEGPEDRAPPYQCLCCGQLSGEDHLDTCDWIALGDAVLRGITPEDIATELSEDPDLLWAVKARFRHLKSASPWRVSGQAWIRMSSKGARVGSVVFTPNHDSTITAMQQQDKDLAKRGWKLAGAYPTAEELHRMAYPAPSGSRGLS